MEKEVTVIGKKRKFGGETLEFHSGNRYAKMSLWKERNIYKAEISYWYEDRYVSRETASAASPRTLTIKVAKHLGLV